MGNGNAWLIIQVFFSGIEESESKNKGDWVKWSAQMAKAKVTELWNMIFICLALIEEQKSDGLREKKNAKLYAFMKINLGF